MKIGRFLKILDQTTVSIDLPYATVLERLMALQGECRDKDGLGVEMEFLCNKKGEFRIANQSRRNRARVCHVAGELIARGNKTDAKIYSLQSKDAKAAKWILAVFGLICLVVCNVGLAHFENAPLSTHIYISLACLISPAIGFFFDHKEEQYVPADLEIMKTDILRRLDAVKRWDE